MNVSRRMHTAVLCVGIATLIAAFASPADAGSVTVYENQYAAWNANLVSSTTVDWDNFTLAEGAYTTLVGTEYAGLTLAEIGSGTGMYVGNPDNAGSAFFGQDFFATSGANVLATKTMAGPGSPTGKLEITFTSPIDALGAFFLDVEGDHAYTGIQIIDGVTDPFFSFSSNQGDNSSSFFGVISTDLFSKAVIHMNSSNGGNGVGIDDLEYGVVPLPSAAWLGLGLLGGLGVIRRIRRRKTA